jgi:hypothetical protein
MVFIGLIILSFGINLRNIQIFGHKHVVYPASSLPSIAGFEML